MAAGESCAWAETGCVASPADKPFPLLPRGLVVARQTFGRRHGWSRRTWCCKLRCWCLYLVHIPFVPWILWVWSISLASSWVLRGTQSSCLKGCTDDGTKCDHVCGSQFVHFAASRHLFFLENMKGEGHENLRVPRVPRLCHLSLWNKALIRPS